LPSDVVDTYCQTPDTIDQLIGEIHALVCATTLRAPQRSGRNHQANQGGIGRRNAI
jgi:hypothetical protein